MKKQNYENELPEGYKQVLHIDAKDAKTGIIMNVVSLLILGIVLAVAYIPLKLNNVDILLNFPAKDSMEFPIAMLLFCIVLFAYIVMHELVHGIAYKCLTGEKLTFGISWSCAFCGVPHIYSYRKTAIISSAAPLVLFSSIFGAITVLLYFVSPIYYLLSAILFGLHLGGCSGDMYIILMLFKYRNPKVLMRDTGPEQFIYIPN